MSQLKNFRLTNVSLGHLEKCKTTLELPSEVAVVKVALAYLYSDRSTVNGWEIFQDVQRRETRKKPNSS